MHLKKSQQGLTGLNALRIYAAITILLLLKKHIFYGCYRTGGGLFVQSVPFHFNALCVKLGLVTVFFILISLWFFTGLVLLILKFFKVNPGLKLNLIIVTLVSLAIVLLLLQTSWIG